MAERPPSTRRVAWEQPQAPGWGSSQQQLDRLREPQAWGTEPGFSASSYLTQRQEERKALQHIQAFLGASEKEEAQKLQFLASICALCRGVDCEALGGDLSDLCSKAALAEEIKVLLEEQPHDLQGIAVRQQALLAITAMSKVRPVLEDTQNNSLLHACICSIFSFPPREDMQSMEALLYDQVLLPFTESQRAAERERAVHKIAQLSKLLTSSSLWEGHVPSRGVQDSTASLGTEHFQMLGQLVARLRLCCSDEDEGTRRGAADALCHLGSFLLKRESGKPSEDSAEHRRLQGDWKAETFWLSWSQSTSDTTMIFGKHLCPSEMTEVILTAIEGMSDSSAYHTLAAARMLAVAMRHSASRLRHASRIVRCIYENLMHVSEQLARRVLLRTLLQLSSLYPEKAVRSLLASSVLCDSVAVAMWRVMVSQPATAEKVLGELLFVLQERRQGRRVCFVEDEPHVVPLAATRALRKILLQPTLQQGKALFPMLCVALLFQISFAMEATLQDVEAFFKTDTEEGRGSPISPVRSALQALQALLHWAGYGEQVGVLHKTGGWDMLICAESHHQGITLLARQLRTSATKECHWIFHHLLLVLSMRDVQREIPSMAFFTELLNCAEFSTAVDEQVLRLFQRHLRTGRLVMRGLVLRGLLMLSESPEVAGKLQGLLPDVMERLHDADRDINVKALCILRNVLHHMERERAGPVALQLAEKLLPLFDDVRPVSSRVRKHSLCLFKALMETVVGKWKRRLRKHVQSSLLLLFFHLSDQAPGVAQASQETLLAAAEFLKWNQLGYLTQTLQTWRIGECLLVQDRSRAEKYLCQSLPYLESPQAALQELAVRFIVLQELLDDGRPSIHCLAAQTILLLDAVQTQEPSGWQCQALCCRLRRLWERWRPPPADDSVVAQLHERSQMLRDLHTEDT
ncbi:maestro heat-like repeat-containing protein family member 7 isoform X3 [Dromaius novaehollandiae]|uniref:maestro heat-like repeat-containing protein family member 7 isoform X3 n=1 Tax=Dromaius novaehollandiae TaxID=8790 RepID=UPI00311E91A9